MCAIAGGQHTRAMLDMMKHRAPDGTHVSDGDFPIGMGRLAIVGETEFPFEYTGSTTVLNGEIYNWKELKRELESTGHHFTTNCDLEVVAHAFGQWGFDCVNRFNGMFALAVRTPDGVFVARDVAGEKPLYFAEAPFRFASENKALRFCGKELPPGHYLWYDFKRKDVTVTRWWNFEPTELYIEDAPAKLEELLGDAIRIRIPDVPYTLYRSGGVDSTLISTYLPKDAQMLTFFDGDYSKDFLENFEKIVWHLDAPIDSFSAYPLWSMARTLSGEGVKVVLSGEGADELFSGYVRYVNDALKLKGGDVFPSYTRLFEHDHLLGWKDFNGKMRDLLRMGDRMAGAWGIENRCPFLDRRVIEFAFSLPARKKAYGYDTKIILREILKKRMPEYRDEEKHGLYASVNKWLGESDPFSKTEYLKKQYEIWTKFQS